MKPQPGSQNLFKHLPYETAANTKMVKLIRCCWHKLMFPKSTHFPSTEDGPFQQLSSRINMALLSNQQKGTRSQQGRLSQMQAQLCSFFPKNLLSWSYSILKHNSGIKTCPWELCFKPQAQKKIISLF